MENYSFSHVVQLAARLGAPVFVYDLEATTFRGRPNFGITEVGCFTVSPGGQAALFGELINPERQIGADAVRLNGITQAMVRDKDTWGKKYARLFLQLASGDAWVTGFNNATFDNPAVVEMNERYGQPFEKFTKTFDVRKLHKKLSGSKTQAGTLGDIAAMYKVKPRGDLHRAMADVILTLELLDAIIFTYGVDAVHEVIMDRAKPKSRSLEGRTFTSDALVLYVRDKERLTLEELAQAFNKEVRSVSFEVGKAIDERLVNAHVFARPDAQAWLSESLIELVDADLLVQGKLKPIYERVNASSPVGEVDYVQLRIGMLSAGLKWSSLKPNDPPF